MKRLYYFLKDFKIDILTTVCAIIGVLLTWIYAPTEKLKTIISIIVIFITLMVIIFSRSRNKDFVFSALTSSKDKEPWMGHGIFQIARVQDAYEITDADPGYIHSKVLAWDNYKFSFEFKIANWGGDGGLGVIVRANNLANYIMLQFKQRGVGPHIRVNGIWKVWQPEEAELVFPEQLTTDSWYKCEIFCDKNTIIIKLFREDKRFFDRVWEIPRGNILFEYKHSSELATEHWYFPITLEYGSVGFRNWGNEKAFVKNVLVKKL